MDPCLKAVSCVFSVLETTVDAKFREQGNEWKRNFIKLRHRKDIIYRIVIRVLESILDRSNIEHYQTFIRLRNYQCFYQVFV